MLTEPVALMLCESRAHFVAVNQLASLGSRVSLFDLGAGVSQPFLVLVEQLKCSLDDFAGVAIPAGTESLGDQLLLFWAEPGGHSTFSRFSAYPASPTGIKPFADGLCEIAGGLRRHMVKSRRTRPGKGAI